MAPLRADRSGPRVNILLLTQVFPPATGGSGRWLWELYRRLTGFDIHVLAGEAEGANAFDASAGMAISRMPLRFANWGVWNATSGPQYVRAFLRIRREVAATKPDAIHCGKCLPEGLLAATIHRYSGIPFVVYVHGEELTLAATSRELTRLTRRVLRAARMVVANSRHTKDMLVGRWGADDSNVEVMHPGVDSTRFVPAPFDAAARARLGWTGRRVILTVGALQKRKGQDMLIRALPAIRARCPDVLYSIVGEGWERAYLDQIVAECGVADLVQFRPKPLDDELIACYQQCDLFALPNRQIGWDFEGFGIVMLEAQACGRPVIAGRSGGTAETMDPSRTGELVNCDGPEELAETAAALLSDPERRAQMGARARQWIVERFDWRVLTDQASRLFTAASRKTSG